MKNRMNYRPDGILITMPVRFFGEYPGGENQVRRIFSLMNDSSIIWGQTISAIPTVEVPYCYLVFMGKVQYRFNIVDFERDASKNFSDGGIVRCFENKNWVNLCAPVIRAPADFPMKGFQGFRYTPFLF